MTIQVGDRVQWQDRTTSRPYLHTEIGTVIAIADEKATVQGDGGLYTVKLKKLSIEDTAPPEPISPMPDHDDPYGIRFMVSAKPGAFDDIVVQAPIGVIRQPVTNEVLFDASKRVSVFEEIAEDYAFALRVVGDLGGAEL